ncbi:MAG: hypothetical protein IPG50_04445 [Myxococcales bacterium]|nr:hypothetical protein [Myxococcales bacterium]
MRLIASMVLASFCVVGCNKSDGTATTTAAVLPADAKTIEAHRKEFPAFGGASSKGKAAKIHGYVQAVGSDLVPITDSADKTVPFVFCKVKSTGGLKAKAHVLAEGIIGETGNIEDCKISAL